MVLFIIMTEKRKPTYDLDAIKETFSDPDGLEATGKALEGALNLGMGRSEMVEVIQTIERAHFFKSMTSYANHRIWQDVYYVPSKHGKLYIKFTSGHISEFLLLSFKGNSNG